MQLRTTILRGLLGRCFGQWRRLTDDRWWKKQLLFRDREIELLERQCGGFRNRPIVVLRKRKLAMCLAAWKAQAARLRRKRLRLARAMAKFRSRQLSAAWGAWLDFANVRNINLRCLRGRTLRVCLSSMPQWRRSQIVYEHGLSDRVTRAAKIFYFRWSPGCGSIILFGGRAEAPGSEGASADGAAAYVVREAGSGVASVALAGCGLQGEARQRVSCRVLLVEAAGGQGLPDMGARRGGATREERHHAKVRFHGAATCLRILQCCA